MALLGVIFRMEFFLKLLFSVLLLDVSIRGELFLCHLVNSFDVCTHLIDANDFLVFWGFCCS